MIKFVRFWFRKLFSILLWVILIGCVIGGFMLGSMGGMGGGFSPFALLGAIGGGIVGLFLIITGGGYVSTILNIDDNLQKIANKDAEENNG